MAEAHELDRVTDLQASSAVTVTYGDTVILATACMEKKPNENVDTDRSFLHGS
jgi:polyribonucleotide nucleotidyltransferase